MATPSYVTDRATAQNLMKMLEYLFTALTQTPPDPAVARYCGNPEWRQQLCLRYDIPSENNVPSKGIGDDIAFYNTNGTGIAATAQAILNAFETNMDGPPTTAIPQGSQLDQLGYTALFKAFLLLLSAPRVGSLFTQANAEQRKALLSGPIPEDQLTDIYGAMQALISTYQRPGPNTQLAQSMQDMSETLYAQYQFIC